MSHKTREQRQEEAAARQAEYDGKTLNEKRVHATDPHRPGNCGRERARLLPKQAA